MMPIIGSIAVALNCFVGLIFLPRKRDMKMSRNDFQRMVAEIVRLDKID